MVTGSAVPGSRTLLLLERLHKVNPKPNLEPTLPNPVGQSLVLGFFLAPQTIPWHIQLDRKQGEDEGADLYQHSQKV